jgi:hypothetical protein
LLVGMAKKIEGDGLRASIDQCGLADAEPPRAGR